MNHWEADTKAYELSQLNTDNDIVLGAILEDGKYVIAAWDTTEYTKTTFKGGFSIEAKRVA